MYKIAVNGMIAGLLFAERVRNRDIISFAYEAAFLSHPAFFNIDPNLLLTTNRQYPLDGRLFGFLSDCSPDRWGKALLRRKSGRPISDVDAVLQVSDVFRMGAIQILDEHDAVLSQSSGIPTIKRLSQLYQTSKHVEDLDMDIKELFDPGSSLGGARPKAGIMEGNTLKLAKFPKEGDQHNVEAWEATLLTLAGKTGITAADHRLIYLPHSSHGILLLDRFDREGDRRVPYISAMTALNCADNEDCGSYIELAEFIAKEGSINDARELYKRMVFNILTRNFDDHLRNHGFLRINDRWRLSPAFDLNPGMEHNRHQLSIDGIDYTPDVESALRLSDYFYYERGEAERWMDNSIEILKEEIKPTAQKHGIKSAEIKRITHSLASVGQT